MSSIREGYFKPVLAIVVVCLIFSGCAKKPSSKTAVKINDYSLTVEEFNEQFAELRIAEDTKQARGNFVNKLITRKLLLQEAQKDGLDKQKDFLKSIENFWEQSLLKIVVDKKIREVSGNITVTEQEVQDYYKVWSQQNLENLKTIDEVRAGIEKILLKQKQSLAVNSWVEELKKGASIDIDKKAIGVE